MGLTQPIPPFSILWLGSYAQSTPFGSLLAGLGFGPQGVLCLVCAVPLSASISCARGLASHLRVATGSLLLAAPSSCCPHRSDFRRLRGRP